jgi:hypothetical protein
VAAELGFGTGSTSAQLTDPDGDGVYTGATQVPQGRERGIFIEQGMGVRENPFGFRFPGEPRSVIRDFGLVRFDGDKTFSASVSFEQVPPADGGSGSLPSTGGRMPCCWSVAASWPAGATGSIEQRPVLGRDLHIVIPALLLPARPYSGTFGDPQPAVLRRRQAREGWKHLLRLRSNLSRRALSTHGGSRGCSQGDQTEDGMITVQQPVGEQAAERNHHLARRLLEANHQMVDGAHRRYHQEHVPDYE